MSEINNKNKYIFNSMYLFCFKKIVHLFFQLDEKSLAHITTQYSYAKYISQHTYITT